EIAEKMAVNSTMSNKLPGKKYVKKDCGLVPASIRNEPERPAPNNSQNTTGVPIEPTIRFRWRKNRMISRQARATAALRAIAFVIAGTTSVEIHRLGRARTGDRSWR